MGRARKTSTRILNEEEIRAAAKLIPKMLGESFARLAKERGLRVEDTLRYGSLAARCAEARSERGLSLKEAAAALKVPQYRVKAIEQGHLSSVQPDVLRRYISYFGLNRWVGRWASANSSLAKKLGLRTTQSRKAV